MDSGCVEVSVWILIVWRLVYGYWLYGGKCMDIDCVEVSVWILVVWRLVYVYKGCVENSLCIRVV